MKYIIYLLAGLLILWSVWYVLRHLKRQLRGGCEGGCAHCCGCSGQAGDNTTKGGDSL